MDDWEATVALLDRAFTFVKEGISQVVDREDVHPAVGGLTGPVGHPGRESERHGFIVAEQHRKLLGAYVRNIAGLPDRVWHIVILTTIEKDSRKDGGWLGCALCYIEHFRPVAIHSD